MKALLFERNVPKFAAATIAGRLAPGLGARFGPISLADIDEPDLPAPEWVHVRPRLSGICGSDLATIDGHSSRYFEPIVSFPFVPGHEVVGELDDGQRVALMATLPCAARGIDPQCAACANGRTNLCERTSFGHLEAGLQTGFCEDTGGGWGIRLVAHPSQLVPVADDLTDEAAVLIEPTACALHAVASAGFSPSAAVIGSGTLGLLTIAALRHSGGAEDVLATAKYAHQRDFARDLGANDVVEPDELERAVRRRVGSLLAGTQLTSGMRTVYDCVGSSESLAQALRIVAPGGTVVAVGMPGITTLDLTPLWHREITMRGSYAYTRADFDAAAGLVAEQDLGRLVSATYPLDRYRDAIEHAANAGSRGAVKIAFDLRQERRR